MNVLEYATQMEIDGEMFYKKQAMKNKDTKLANVFMSMAEDEKKHAEIIKEKLASKDLFLDNNDIKSNKNVFSDANGLDYEKGFAEQVDIYEQALDMEEKSITLYEKLLKENKDDKDIFEFLIEQEKTHYKLLEEMVEMVNRPNEWVESAEFGLRTEKY